jgi:hypothetical protein
VLVLLAIIFGSTTLYYGLALASETTKVTELQNVVSEMHYQARVPDSASSLPVVYQGNVSASSLNPVAIYDGANGPF